MLDDAGLTNVVVVTGLCTGIDRGSFINNE